MKLDCWDIKRIHQPLIIRTVCAWLDWLTVVRNDIEAGVDHFHKRLYK